MKQINPRRMIYCIAFYGIVANLVHPISPTIYTSLGFHDYMFGVAFACMSITNFALSPFWSRMFDRYGCRRPMALCGIGYGCCQLLFGLSKTELALSIARLLAGCFISGISVGQLVYVMRYSTKERTSQNLMYLSTTAAVMAPIGFLIGGFLGDVTLMGTIWTQAVGLWILSGLFFLLLEDGPVEKAPMSRTDWLAAVNPLKSFRQVGPYLNSFLVIFFSVVLVTSFASTCYEQSFNYLIKAEYGFPSSYNGMLKALVGIVALFSNLTLCRWLLKKTESRKSTVWVLGVQMILSTGVALVTPLIPFIILNILFFGLNAVYLPLLQSTMTQSTEKERSSIFAAMFNAVRSIGMILGSLVAGVLYSIHSRLPFRLTAALFTLALLLALWNARSRDCQ